MMTPIEEKKDEKVSCNSFIHFFCIFLVRLEITCFTFATGQFSAVVNLKSFTSVFYNNTIIINVCASTCTTKQLINIITKS